jgi:hypothetical protein
MKFRSLRFIAWISCFTLINVVVQFDGYARADNVDGFEFRALVPDAPLLIPNDGSSTNVRFGVRISNHSTSEKKFLRRYLIPTFLDETSNVIAQFNDNGKGIPNSARCYMSHEVVDRIPDGPVFDSLKPGESLEIFNVASLYRKDGKTIIHYLQSDGWSCRSDKFNPGKYYFFMTYEFPSLDRFEKMGVPKNIDRGEIWMKAVKIAPIPFTLTEDKRPGKMSFN